MKDAEIDLVNYIKTIEEVNRVLNDPERVKWLAEISKAQLLEGKYEYGQAIDIYEKARQAVKSLDTPDLQKRIARLKSVWDKAKGDKQFADARNFVYLKWPTLDLNGLKASLKKVEGSHRRSPSSSESATGLAPRE